LPPWTPTIANGFAALVDQVVLDHPVAVTGIAAFYSIVDVLNT
jgi:hypothetical protein